MQLHDLKSYKELVSSDRNLASQVESVYNATKETINSISGCYNNYTMHDIGHCIRVASYMEQIAFGLNDNFEINIKKFSAFELALLILSALLHDIGMFIRPEDKENIRNNKILYTSSLTFDGVLKAMNNNEDEAIKEIVRITHAQRINEFIDYKFGEKTISSMLMLDDKYPYADDVVAICVAHGENYDYLKNLRKNNAKGKYQYNLQFLAAILRIADYLDLDKQRTPILWYKMMRIDGFSKEEWERHFIIHNETKLKEYIDNKMQIFFDGKSSNAKIHRKYLSYIDELKRELDNAEQLLNTKTAEERYLFKITTKIEDNVSTEGFKYSDLRLNLNYSAITELLMGKNIYGDNRLGLREIIQNSIDACELMKEIQQKGEDVFIEPQIIISFSQKNNYVKIKDTGIGMTLDIVKKHFLNIGKSYYKSNEYIYENYNYKPIGQYGIGFLACFLLSDNVVVKTKHYKTNEINQIELEKNSEYVVTNTEETGSFFGTEIILDYNKFFEVFSNKSELFSFLEKYFYTTIPIKVKDEDCDPTPILINNCCNKIIENKISKDSTNKYTTIVCEEYSDTIKGVFEICDEKAQKSYDIIDLKNSKNQYYYFDKTTQTFSLLDDPSTLDVGYYSIIQYANISADEYKIIKKTRKKASNKRNEILSVNSEKLYLIIKDDNKLSYGEVDDSDDDFQVKINDSFIKSILINSNFNYYEELVSHLKYFSPIFIYDCKYVNIQRCYFQSMIFYGHNEDDSQLDFYFYNRGVWIKDFGMLVCFLPYAYKLLGVANYNGDKIKLDVSRNYIIDGEEKLKYDFANIILKFKKQHSENQEWKRMLDCMIDYNNNQI